VYDGSNTNCTYACFSKPKRAALFTVEPSTSCLNFSNSCPSSTFPGAFGVFGVDADVFRLGVGLASIVLPFDESMLCKGCLVNKLTSSTSVVSTVASSLTQYASEKGSTGVWRLSGLS